MIFIIQPYDESNLLKKWGPLFLSEIPYMKKTVDAIEVHYLTINKIQTMHGLQREFNKHFPYLKIEFIRDDIKKGSRDPKNIIISTNEVISHIQKIVHTGKIAFNKFMTVNELESTFLRDYGLHVQVFRKSGNIWLVTTSTDDWTLEQQNEEGKSLAQHLKIDLENADDHDFY